MSSFGVLYSKGNFFLNFTQKDKEDIGMGKNVRLEVMSGLHKISVGLDDISYISILKHGCRVHMDVGVMKEGRYGEEPEEGFFVRKSLRTVYEDLKKYGFVYAHNSYIVNLRQVRSIDMNGQMLIFKSEEKLKISRSRKEKFKKSLYRLKREEKRVAEEKEKSHLELENQNRMYREIVYELKKNIAMIDIFYEQADYDEMRKIIKKLKEIIRMAEM